jgi:hypothetical protein
MGTRGETLAKQFEAKVQEALAVVEQLSDVDWKKVTAAEHWPVGVTAHHLANAFEIVPGVVTAIVSRDPRGGFTRAMLDQGNAHHAQEHAHCTKAETVALLKKGGAAAAATIRVLTDDQLSKRAPVFTDAPPMTAEQLIQGALIHHVDEHIGSIRKTVVTEGHAAAARRYRGPDACCGTLPFKVHLPSAVHGRRVSGGRSCQRVWKQRSSGDQPRHRAWLTGLANVARIG